MVEKNWGWFGNRSSGEGIEFEVPAVTTNWGWFGNRSSGEGLEFTAPATAWADHAWLRDGQYIMAAEAGGATNYADSLLVGAYVISGKTVSDLYARNDGLSVGAYALSGKNITDLYARNDGLSVGAYVIAGQNVTDVYTSGPTDYSDALLVGSYIYAGQQTTDLLARNDSLSVGSYSITGNDLTDVTPPEEVSGGSGYPVYGKYERPKGIGEFLDVAMSEIYEAATEDDVPRETKEAFVKVVRPYTKSRAKVPDVEKIDWEKFEKDVERISQMLALWQQVLDDEEVIIMGYLQYYH